MNRFKKGNCVILVSQEEIKFPRLFTVISVEGLYTDVMEIPSKFPSCVGHIYRQQHISDFLLYAPPKKGHKMTKIFL